MRTPRWVVVTYVVIILAGILAALPNMFTPAQLAAMPGWVPKHQITLGLDLQGGSHLVLEVDAAALKTDRLRSLLDDVRGALRKERIDPRSARVSSGIITLTVADPAQVDKAVAVLSAMATPVGISRQNDIEVTSEGNLIKVALTEKAGARRPARSSSIWAGVRPTVTVRIWSQRRPAPSPCHLPTS